MNMYKIYNYIILREQISSITLVNKFINTYFTN
jgi:hypothetical protein